MCQLSSLSHPDDYVHGRPREKVTETPSDEILYREIDDKLFG
jgi:hypothetical protein